MLQDPTFHDWPGPVDYLLRDDLLTRTSNRMYGYKELPKEMQGKTQVERDVEIEDMLYIIGYPYAPALSPHLSAWSQVETSLEVCHMMLCSSR